MIKPKISTPPLVGLGLYTPREASRLLGVRVASVNHWIGERKGTFAVIVARRLQREHLLTFSELMELHLVKMFRAQGVSLQTIRCTAVVAAKRYKTDYPFAVKRFDTDGKTIFATLLDKEKNRTIIEDVRRGQLVFEQIIQPFFRKLDFDQGDMAERYWPCDRHGRIVLDRSRRFGQPIDFETGVPTGTIRDALVAGGGQEPDVVAKWLNIPLEAVQAASAFEQSLNREISVRQ
jgi:uncharacterized protein (DUF433 family)